MKQPSAEQIRRTLDAHQLSEMGALPGRTNHIRAAVLVPLVWRPKLCALLTIRSDNLRIHPGDPCFPGGRSEDGDSSLLDTALREAREELHIVDPTVLGRLSSVPLYTSDHRIEPFVAALANDELQPNPGEVKEVIYAPLLDLLEQDHLDAIPWRNGQEESLSPVFSLEGHLVFGATAHSLYELLEVVAVTANREMPSLRAGRFTWQDAMPGFVAPWT
jgi:8-oxo-dGTP pyrophosphatase MutT (NUDIX family)